MTTDKSLYVHEKCTRTKLLNKLGLFHKNQKKLSLRELSHPKSSQRSILGSVVPFEMKLKSEEESSVNVPEGSLPSMVQFNEKVTVVNIPSRYQYSDRVKKVIWSNRWELQEMAERNYFEFAAEGFDWQNVVLDDDMFVDSISGELIHPCHLDNVIDGEDSKNEASFTPLTRCDDSFTGLGF